MKTRFYKILYKNKDVVYVGVTLCPITERFRQHVASKELNENYSVVEFDCIEHPEFTTLEVFYAERKKVAELEQKYIREELEKGSKLLNISKGGEWGSVILDKFRREEFCKEFGSYDNYKEYRDRINACYLWVSNWIINRSQPQLKVWIRHWIEHRSKNVVKTWVYEWMYKRRVKKAKNWVVYWIESRSKNKTKALLREWIRRDVTSKAKKWLKNWGYRRGTNLIKRWVQHWISHRSDNKIKVWVRSWISKSKQCKTKIWTRSWINSRATNKVKRWFHNWTINRS